MTFHKYFLLLASKPWVYQFLRLIIGEISDREKEKVENMTEVIEKQKEELAEQRRQLLELSALLDEQKSKLIEQDQKIVKQNNALAFHAESAVTRSTHVDKQKEHNKDEVIEWN